MKKGALLLSILFLSSLETTAQVSIAFLFEQTADSLVFEKYKGNMPKIAADSLAAAHILRGSLRGLQAQGFAEASFDTIVRTDSTLTAKLHLGKRYVWTHINTHSIPPQYLAEIGFRKGLLDKKNFSPQALFDMETRLLSFVESIGYPFAQVWLDSLAIDEGQVSAQIKLREGQFFRFDTIQLVGLLRLNPRFLENYLDIRRGSAFNREKVLRLTTRLSELPYLSLRQSPTMRFTEGGKAHAILYLDPRKASRWDFLVGVQPNTAADGSQKFGITFNGTADLQNLLGMGESLFANFENLRPQSPRLKVKLAYPYILNLPFGFDGSFDLYKRDTTYIETFANAGAQYLFGGSDYLKLFWQNYRASNLIVNALEIKRFKRLPPTLDVTTNMAGLEFSKQKLDYRFNPRRGWALILRGGAGLRLVRQNSDILSLSDTSFNFARLYDTVPLRSFQYRADIKAEVFIPILKRSTLKLGMTGGGFLSATPIALNEQYRIGGNRLLRGFDEESLFVTRYAVSSLEYRLLIGRNSFLYAFGDFAYTENHTRTSRSADFPMGFGAGITFETKVGLFGVTLALGRQEQNPVDFRNVKTHFGYVSLF